jgi:NAD(P)-dependent dehydrogenase (short-subunit alcohol dehydrogenase family)
VTAVATEPWPAGTPRGFDQELFLVTGGSSGIGRAVAIGLAHRGARVLVSGRDPRRLAETLAALPGQGHAPVPGALAGLDPTSAWICDLARAHGPLRGVVHSAGVHSVHPLRALRQAQLADVTGIDIDVPLGLLKGFRQKSSHGPNGSVVFIASVMGLVGAPSRAAYCAGKGALIALARAAAVELAGEGIRVNCVAPGYVATDMLERLRTQLTDEQFEAIRARHPLGFGRPEDVAEAVLFLLGDAARWITGTALAVDGGYTAQ